LVVDEMAFVDEITYETTLPLIATTNGMVYGISTVNPETPKNYFYYNLIFAETEMLKPEASEYYARRVTLDENPFIPEEEKAKIKARSTNADLFNAEWMCAFLDKTSYNTQDFWVIDEEPVEVNIDGRWKTFWKKEALDKTMNSIYTKFLIAHDGAKRKDKP
jgi:hypothetical protein